MFGVVPSVTVISLAAAAGLVVGWALCHVAHSRARSDAVHFRSEAETLRRKAISLVEERTTAEGERDEMAQKLAAKASAAKQSATAQSGGARQSGTAPPRLKEAAGGQAENGQTEVIDLGSSVAAGQPTPPVKPGRGL